MENFNDRLINFCQELIRIPSLAGKERQVAQRVREEMYELNFDECNIDLFGSVIGIIRNGAGPTIIFDAHIDTVGVEPIDEWNFDPFGGWIEDDKIYGRGAVDMKGPAAAIVYGIALLKEHLNEFRGTVVASLSTLEEVCEGVALANVIDNFGGDYIVIGEATNLKLVRGQRGRAEIALTTHGVPTHSSTPQFGVDAVAKMMKLIEQMQVMPMPSHPFLGNGVQALTDIISTPYPSQSMVPSKCRATFDRRLIIGESENSILAELNEMLNKVILEDKRLKAEAEIVTARYSSYTGHEVEFKKFMPAWEFPENHSIVRAGLKALAIEGISNESPTHYNFCTNGSLPERHFGIPTIGFGPGLEDLAHRKDEFIGMRDLIASAKGYAAIAKAISNIGV